MMRFRLARLRKKSNKQHNRPSSRCLVGESLEARQLLATVTPSADIVGSTPEIVGYNVAHFMPGSNTESWWQYSGANGARLWASSNTVEGSDDNEIWGDGVTDRDSFLGRRDDLRNDPLNTDFINWPYFEDRYENKATTGNILQINYALERLNANGIEVLAMINRSVGSYPFDNDETQADYYEDRWEYWQHYYVQAFHMSRHYDVEKYQMYNEPNHSSNVDLTPAGYLERLQLASDAIHSAIADVNTRYGKSLTAQVHGPVNSGGNKVFSNSGTGWGELIIDNRHTDLFGDFDPQNDIFQTYAYHRYNVGGTEAGTTLASVKNDVNTASGGEDISVAITEFSIHSNSTFDDLSETLDTPSKYKAFGSILSELANNQPDELYVFKFGQTDNGSEGVKKNGTHYVDNDSAPYNTGGSTKSAAVIQLFTKGFQGSKSLLSEPVASGSGASNLRMAASHDSEQGQYYLFSTNISGSSTTQATFDLSDWNIEEGTIVTVEQVSETHHGEIAHLVTVPASGIISIEQAGSTAMLLTIPDGSPRSQLVLNATDDASVSAGANANVNYGNHEDLDVRNDPTNANERSVSYLKFNLGTVDPASINQAVLQVVGEDTLSSDGVISHVYGLLDDSWDEDTLTWNTAPNLSTSVGDVDTIDNNFVEGIGTNSKFLGHLTSQQDSALLQLDVTDLLKTHGDQFASFLITREVRFNGEDVSGDAGSLEIASKERTGDVGPKLQLFFTDDFDWGDAPSPLPTVLADDGARHLATGPRLGPSRDTEVNGQPAADSLGDDSVSDDEDGVMFGTIAIGNSLAGVNIDLQNAEDARVDAWLDFDGDGIWQDDEKILDRVLATNVDGAEVFNFAISSDAVAGMTFARVRVSNDGGLASTGVAYNGEVEDYMVEIVTAPSVESVEINQGEDQRSSLNVIDVHFDQEVIAPASAFQVRDRDSGLVLNNSVVNSLVNQLSGKTTSRLTFGDGGNLVIDFDDGLNSLVNGNYELLIDRTQIESVENGAAMSHDFVSSDHPADTFFRKYGDYDGSGTVGLSDFARFRQAFGLDSEDSGYLRGFDSDNDQVIGLADFAAFRGGFGT